MLRLTLVTAILGLASLGFAGMAYAGSDCGSCKPKASCKCESCKDCEGCKKACSDCTKDCCKPKQSKPAA